jgi:hypothetical protein
MDQLQGGHIIKHRREISRALLSLEVFIGLSTSRINFVKMKKSEIILSTIILIMIWILSFVVGQYKLKSSESDRKSSIIREKTDSIKYIQTESGKIAAQKSAALARVDELEASYPELMDVINDMRIEIKNVKAVVRNEFEARGQGNSTINNHYYTDSIGVKRNYWELKASDGYFTFNAKVYDSLNAPWTHTYRDTVTTVIHSDHKWWHLRKEKLFASSVMENPSAKITGTTNVLVDTYKDRRFGLMVGMSYSPLTPRTPVLPTITIGYNVFKF